MRREEGQTSEEGAGYFSKSVMVNGQPVTLYSVNGVTWLSSPEELHEVMDRLDNTRIRLHDPKGETSPIAPKPTAARYRLRGPKSRPILEQEGRRIAGTNLPESPVVRPQYRIDIDLEEPSEGHVVTYAKPPKGAKRGKSGGEQREELVTASSPRRGSEEESHEGRIAMTPPPQAATPAAIKQGKRGALAKEARVGAKTKTKPTVARASKGSKRAESPQKGIASTPAKSKAKGAVNRPTKPKAKSSLPKPKASRGKRSAPKGGVKPAARRGSGAGKGKAR